MIRQFIALILTLSMELIAILIFIQFNQIKKLIKVNQELILTILSASLCTHPIAWYVNQHRILNLNAYEKWFLIELIVILIEALFYWKIFGGFRAILFSMGANLFSAILGLKIYYFLLFCFKI
jgi:hypothetical protein